MSFLCEGLNVVFQASCHSGAQILRLDPVDSARKHRHTPRSTATSCSTPGEGLVVQEQETTSLCPVCTSLRQSMIRKTYCTRHARPQYLDTRDATKVAFLWHIHHLETPDSSRRVWHDIRESND